MPVDAGDEFSQWIFQLTDRDAKNLAEKLLKRAGYTIISNNKRKSQLAALQRASAAGQDSKQQSKAFDFAQTFTIGDNQETIEAEYAKTFESMGVPRPEAAKEAVWFSKYLEAYSQAISGGIGQYNLAHDGQPDQWLRSKIIVGRSGDGDLVTEVQISGPNDAYEKVRQIRQQAAVAAAMTMKNDLFEVKTKGIYQEDLDAASRALQEHLKDTTNDSPYRNMLDNIAAESSENGISFLIRPCDSALLNNVVGGAAAIKLRDDVACIDLSTKELEEAERQGILHPLTQDEKEQTDKQQNARTRSTRQTGRTNEDPGQQPNRAPDDREGSRGVSHDVIVATTSGTEKTDVAHVWCRAQEREALLQRLREIGATGKTEKEASRDDDVSVSRDAARMDASRAAGAEWAAEKAHVEEEQQEFQYREGREAR